MGKKKKKLFPTRKAENEFYWGVLIKARAGFKSELSGKDGELHPHHLRGKPNNALRYSLLNGICCTAYEHKFLFHNTDKRYIVEEKVKQLRGRKIFESLESMTNENDNESQFEIKEGLLKQLKPYERDIKEWFESKDYKNYYYRKKYKYLFEQLREI